jgi:hypothetical protein
VTEELDPVVSTPRRRRRVVAKAPEAVARAEAVQTRTPVKRVRIILEENPNIPKHTGQFFGVNGYTAYLRPGMEASVPEFLVNVLEDASEHVPVTDERTLQIVDWRKKYRYPFRVLGPA